MLSGLFFAQKAVQPAQEYAHSFAFVGGQWLERGGDRSTTPLVGSLDFLDLLRVQSHPHDPPIVRIPLADGVASVFQLLDHAARPAI